MGSPSPMLGTSTSLLRAVALAVLPLGGPARKRRERAFGEDDVVAAENVVGVELAGGDQMNLGGVAEALPGHRVAPVGNDEH